VRFFAAFAFSSARREGPHFCGRREAQQKAIEATKLHVLLAGRGVIDISKTNKSWGVWKLPRMPLRAEGKHTRVEKVSFRSGRSNVVEEFSPLDEGRVQLPLACFLREIHPNTHVEGRRVQIAHFGWFGGHVFCFGEAASEAGKTTKSSCLCPAKRAREGERGRARADRIKQKTTNKKRFQWW